VPLRTEATIRRLCAEGLGISTIAKRVGCGVGTVQRVAAERPGAAAEPVAP